MRILPSDDSYKTFCDIVTAYRFAAAMNRAVESGIIDIVGQNGATGSGIIDRSGMKQPEGLRFLALLVEAGILEKFDDLYCPSQFSRRFLLRESSTSQLHTLEFEKLLIAKWGQLGDVLQNGQGSNMDNQPEEACNQRRALFQMAMREAALARSKELWAAVGELSETGVIIDIGAGDGTYLREFLARHPGWRAVAADLPEVLSAAMASSGDRAIDGHALNLLEPRELDAFIARYKGKASLVLLSNIVHCYSELENAVLLGKLAELPHDGGRLLVHDFFRDSNGFGAMYDLHMMVNTYNGRSYSSEEMRGMLAGAGFPCTSIVELQSYSCMISASRQPCHAMSGADVMFRIRQEARNAGFFEAVSIDPSEIVSEAWVKAKCSYGCMYHGRKWSCPPHSPTVAEFRELLGNYTRALVVAGQPPLQEFQTRLLELEKSAFLLGCKKALVFSGGPCTWCETCDERQCRHPEKRRPSLESCGCDVFALAERCGIVVRPIRNSDDFVQYIGLLLVE